MTETSDTLVGRAARYALAAHGTQVRRWTGEPYFVHLAGVADILKRWDASPRTIAVGYLHDTIEDAGVTHGDLTLDFDLSIADDVLLLTDPVPVPGGPNRAARKAATRARLGAAPDHVQTVKVADLLHNGESIFEHDKKFARTFVSEAAALLRVLRSADRGLSDHLERQLSFWGRHL